MLATRFTIQCNSAPHLGVIFLRCKDAAAITATAPLLPLAKTQTPREIRKVETTLLYLTRVKSSLQPQLIALSTDNASKKLKPDTSSGNNNSVIRLR